MFARIGKAILVLLLGILVAVVLLITVGWKLALLVATLAVVISGVMAVRAVWKFAEKPFEDPFFKGSKKG